MNSVIILPEELNGNCAIVREARAVYLYDTHELREGIECKAAVLGARRGKAKVLRASRDEVEFEVQFTEDPLPRTRCVIIAAVARPQTVKKILQLTASVGIEELHFVQTENTEKSYLKSKVFQAMELRNELIKGLEQSCDSVPPLVQVHTRYWYFKKKVLHDLLARYPNARKVLLHTRAVRERGPLEVLRSQQVFIALGPESGWSQVEIEDFEKVGFDAMSLGDRVLRIEHALAFAISRVEYARQSNAWISDHGGA